MEPSVERLLVISIERGTSFAVTLRSVWVTPAGPARTDVELIADARALLERVGELMLRLVPRVPAAAVPEESASVVDPDPARAAGGLAAAVA